MALLLLLLTSKCQWAEIGKMAGQGNAAKTLAVGLRAISISTEYTVEPTIKQGDDKSATPIYLLYCVDTMSLLYILVTLCTLQLMYR